MSLTYFGVGQSSTYFTFSVSILIPSSSIITFKNPTSLTFYLYFSGFMYKSFASNLLITSATISSCPFLSSVPTITLSMKAATFPIFIKSLSNSFIIAWNMAGEFINLKNMMVDSKNLFGVVKAVFHSSLSFILISLQPCLKSIFVNTFLVPIFLITISGKGQLFFIIYSLRYRQSCTILFFPSFFLTKNTGAIWDDFKSLMYPFLNCFFINSHISLFSSLNKEYIFLFLSPNPFFILSQTLFSLYLYNQWTNFHKLSCAGKPQMRAICVYVECTKATTND